MDLHFNENITGWLEFIGPTKEDFLQIGKFVWEKDRTFNETDYYTLSTNLRIKMLERFVSMITFTSTFYSQ